MLAGGVGGAGVSSVCSELLNPSNCIESLAGDKDILKVSSVFVTTSS